LVLLWYHSEIIVNVLLNHLLVVDVLQDMLITDLFMVLHGCTDTDFAPLKSW
jgi:hypothetical protein